MCQAYRDEEQRKRIRRLTTVMELKTLHSVQFGKLKKSFFFFFQKSSNPSFQRAIVDGYENE